MKKISIIIPCYNAEAYIKDTLFKVFDTITNITGDWEMIVVDDGSTDDTRLAIENINMKYIDHTKTIFKPTNRGKGSAVRTGMKVATGDYIFIIDADLQVSPKELKVFFNIMETYNADVVMGNKRHAYSTVRYPLFRWIVSNGYAMLIRLLFGFPIRDTQVGCKLFKTKAIKEILPLLTVNRYAFDIELLIALKANGYRVADAPVYMLNPVGKGSVSPYNIIYTLWDTLKVWVRKLYKLYTIKRKGE